MEKENQDKSHQGLPQGFVYLNDPRMILTMNYCTDDNFIGRPIRDYLRPVCILTEKAASALMRVQDALDAYQKNYKLRIFDAYRPTTAVEDFKAWVANPKDEKMKSHYYPRIEKSELFNAGYISLRSQHSRGSTVDLTIAIQNAGSDDYQDLDMGTKIDFFGEESHTAYANLSAIAKQNRQFFVKLMETQGFQNYHKEWWHYCLKDEPFPDTYFDFPIQ